MPIEQLIFVGLNGYALALHRETGEIVWSNRIRGGGYVTLLLDGDRLIVSVGGYMYCLDAGTGKIRWHNPLKGYGMETPTALASARAPSSQAQAQQVAEQQASAAATMM